MAAVALAVHQVVEDVDRAGGQTEGDESDRDAPDGRQVRHAPREDQREIDEQVLDPLLRAHQPEQREGARRRVEMVATESWRFSASLGRRSRAPQTTAWLMSSAQRHSCLISLRHTRHTATHATTGEQ